jgi:hypothetical protein
MSYSLTPTLQNVTSHSRNKLSTRQAMAVGPSYGLSILYLTKDAERNANFASALASATKPCY